METEAKNLQKGDKIEYYHGRTQERFLLVVRNVSSLFAYATRAGLPHNTVKWKFKLDYSDGVKRVPAHKDTDIKYTKL